MDVYKTEDEQVEALKEWWKENGTSAVLGVALGLGAIFGWRAWQAHQIAEAEAASVLFQELVAAVREPNPDKAKQSAGRIEERYSKTAYAIFARLILARLAVEASDLDAAAGHLRWALEKNTESALEREIQLRLARVLSAQEKFDEAITLLDLADAGEYAATYDELRGDIEVLRGNPDAARAAYERALGRTRPAGADGSLLELKLDNLGRKPPS